MNPWRAHVLELLRNVVRFTIWMLLSLSAVMLAVFVVWFAGNFLMQAADYLKRTLFTKPW